MAVSGVQSRFPLNEISTQEYCVCIELRLGTSFILRFEYGRFEFCKDLSEEKGFA